MHVEFILNQMQINHSITFITGSTKLPQSQPLSYFSEKCVSSQFIAYLPRQIWFRDEWWSFRILKAIINREHIRESSRNCCNSHQSPSFQALKIKWRWERNREPLGWLLQLPPICIVAGAKNQDPMWFTRRRCKVDPPQLAIPHPGDRRMAKHLCTLRERERGVRDNEDRGCRSYKNTKMYSGSYAYKLWFCSVRAGKRTCEKKHIRKHSFQLLAVSSTTLWSPVPLPKISLKSTLYQKKELDQK